MWRALALGMVFSIGNGETEICITLAAATTANLKGF